MDLFFSDLDGTLLDFDTYSFRDSLEGISFLRERGVKLVPVSSKTFEEMESVVRTLGLSGPFAFENGAGIGFPSGKGSWDAVTYGPGLEEIESAVLKLAGTAGGEARLLRKMSIPEICRITGLQPDQSRLARKRLASAPFLIDRRGDLSEKEMESLNTLLVPGGLTLTRGGRFYHVVPSGCGKDSAVDRIREYFSDRGLSAAAGDGENDLPMLEAVDYPFLVRRPGGRHVQVPERVRITDGAGPAGFTEAVKIFINIIQD